ncbi:class I SAM-dependent methyltransferase [Telmatobacter bradus]|uniref:class I SAM-dependent methyltransferase n=1 Tax=Telmatobacter bradus TaxID=474953 RepID=UPI003B42A902
MASTLYSSSFYSTYVEESRGSAGEILAFLDQTLHPQSVVDVGCGIGTWLSVWADLGVDRLLGIDGQYVQPADLLIPSAQFLPMNLEEPDTSLQTRFDLVESLEVAEHLAEDKAAGFVEFLCLLGPVVLFSAAIPHQGGVHHVNEQWPEYWAELFARQGYRVIDGIRPQVWNNPKVAYYYAQNSFLYVQESRTDLIEKINLHRLESEPLARVHPRKWQEKNEVKPGIPPLESLLLQVPASTVDLGRRAVRQLLRILHGGKKENH